MVRFRRHLVLGILLIGTAMIFLVCAVRLSGMAADDSFIHRRIATNLQLLGRPYFNPDQRVMTTSSPLWTVLLATAGAVLPVADPVPLLELLFVLLGAAAAYLLAQEEQRKGLPGLIFPAMAFLLVFVGEFRSSMDQMETPLAIALILAGSLGVLTRKNWGMPLLVLACFVRYECVVFCALAAGWVSVRRRWTKASLVSCAAIGLCGAAWLLREYGTVIPNTVVAKSHLYVLTYRQAARFIASIPQALVCAALGMGWWFYGRNRSRGPHPAALLLAGFGTLLGLAYVLRKTFIFAWYLPLILVPLSLGILLWTNRQSWRPAVLGAAFSGALLFPLAVGDAGLVLAAFERAPGDIPDFPVVARVHEYGLIGAALYGECPTGVLMTSEIGRLGWSFHGRILDGAGLASPEAIHYHPMKIPNERRSGSLGEIPAAFVRDKHPDLIVSYDLLAESALPAARALGYVDYSYPLFDREDRASANSLWEARQMHVLVDPYGHCSPAAVDRAVRAALEK